MNCKILLKKSLFTIPFLWLCSVQADVTTTTFQVSATVLGDCAVSATALSFGDYDTVSGSALDGQSTITVNCTSGTAYDIQLNPGTGSGATVASRQMTLGSDVLEYTLYNDAARTTVWGESTGTVAATALATPTNHTVYGRVFSGQNVPAGTYWDIITVTVAY